MNSLLSSPTGSAATRNIVIFKDIGYYIINNNSKMNSTMIQTTIPNFYGSAGFFYRKPTSPRKPYYNNATYTNSKFLKWI